MAVKVAVPPAGTPQSQKTNWSAYLYLGPVLISTLLFIILPFLYTLYISFTNYSLFNFIEFELIGLQNYIDIFSTGSAFFPVLGWTITWMIGSTALNIGVGMGLAMLLNNPKLAERNIYRTLLIIPWALPFILTVQIWAGLYNIQGPINLILSWFGIDSINWLNQIGPARAALLILNLWLSYPFFMTVCLAALQAIPADLYEATDMDGANAWQRFQAITFPFMLAAITPLIITQLAFQFGNAGVIVLLTNGNPIAYPGANFGATDTLATYAYKLIFQLRLYGLNAAYSIIIFFILAAMTIINSIVTGAFKETDGWQLKLARQARGPQRLARLSARIACNKRSASGRRAFCGSSSVGSLCSPACMCGCTRLRAEATAYSARRGSHSSGRWIIMRVCWLGSSRSGCVTAGFSVFSARRSRCCWRHSLATLSRD
ncbi:sugar ABC transporter permease [Candidatus Gracilibacteria bacterium]|nr:sugar ABC transporter permease [Candidatus Gracilibacteria bacterium]